jgi:hypothetical protein
MVLANPRYAMLYSCLQCKCPTLYLTLCVRVHIGVCVCVLVDGLIFEVIMQQYFFA